MDEEFRNRRSEEDLNRVAQGEREPRLPERERYIRRFNAEKYGMDIST
jgi:hypothetical protein